MFQLRRRSALKVVVITIGGVFLIACQRALNAVGSGSVKEEAVPTLAEIGHIRATQTAQPDPQDLVSAAASDSISTPPAQREEATQRVETTWPSVSRTAEGFLVTSPVTRFYENRYRTASERPTIDEATWQLTVDGLVQYPTSLTMEDIRALPSIEAMRTLECISNPVGGSLVGNTIWRGVRLADVLSAAEPKPGSRELKISNADGYETSIPLELALDPDSLLVYEMDGDLLPIKHGFPLRLLLPGRYGQKQPKWITGLSVIHEEFLGYWEQRGWSNAADVQVNSQIWEPRALEAISGETIVVSGIAYAGSSGVAQVEVSTDDGISWKDADVIPGPSSLVWTEWRYEWTPSAASETRSATLAVRAVDGNGTIQRPPRDNTGILDSTFPNGTSDIHRIAVTVRAS